MAESFSLQCPSQRSDPKILKILLQDTKYCCLPRKPRLIVNGFRILGGQPRVVRLGPLAVFGASPLLRFVAQFPLAPLEFVQHFPVVLVGIVVVVLGLPLLLLLQQIGPPRRRNARPGFGQVAAAGLQGPAGVWHGTTRFVDQIHHQSIRGFKVARDWPE